MCLLSSLTTLFISRTHVRYTKEIQVRLDFSFDLRKKIHCFRRGDRLGTFEDSGEVFHRVY